MKWLPIYSDVLHFNSGTQVFQYLLEHLLPTISTWDYFVDWAKVNAHVDQLKEPLNLLNSVIGEHDVSTALRDLFSRHPEVATVLPILIACRGNRIDVLDMATNGVGPARSFDFVTKSLDLESTMDFCRQSGILALLTLGSTRNLVDYVRGVEVGLDTNGRKNRSGALMETIVGRHVADICGRHNLDYLLQAYPKDIRERWDIDIRADKADRRFDFAVRVEPRKTSLLEVNFYSGPGSKLKSTASEYKELQAQIKSSAVNLIWITDGPGWKSTWRPLRDTYDANDYVLNMKLIQDGALEQILTCDNCA
jgi:type II restriction enzyme